MHPAARCSQIEDKRKIAETLAKRHAEEEALAAADAAAAATMKAERQAKEAAEKKAQAAATAALSKAIASGDVGQMQAAVADAKKLDVDVRHTRPIRPQCLSYI